MRRRLIVHPAKSSTFSIERDAAFDYARIEFVLGKLPFRPTVRKEATFVLKPIRLYDECPLELCFLKDHAVMSLSYPPCPTRSSGIGMMNFPPRSLYSACCSRISSAKFQVSSRV